MNKREQAKKQAAVMLKYANGAEIECIRNNARTWFGLIPDWNWVDAKYRVKQSGSDKVREMLKQNKPVLCGVASNKQCSADANADDQTNLRAIRVYENGVFLGENAEHYTYASPVDLSQFATMEDPE